MKRFFYVRKYLNVFIISLFSILLCSCNAKLNQFEGTWVGIDESNPNQIVMYEYEIALAEQDKVSIRVIRSAYEHNDTMNTVYWTASLPKYFPGTFKAKEGVIVTSFGVLEYSVAYNNIVYNKINFIRKAKNSELKLREVARNVALQRYPEAVFAD